MIILHLEFKEIKKSIFFPSGRWDIEISSGILIKLPNEKLKESLDLSLNLLNNEKFECKINRCTSKKSGYCK